MTLDLSSRKFGHVGDEGKGMLLLNDEKRRSACLV